MRGFEELNAEYQAVLGLIDLGCLHSHLMGCCTCSQLSSPLRMVVPYPRSHTASVQHPSEGLLSHPRGSRKDALSPTQVPTGGKVGELDGWSNSL